jgi:hypothetical protein
VAVPVGEGDDQDIQLDVFLSITVAAADADADADRDASRGGNVAQFQIAADVANGPENPLALTLGTRRNENGVIEGENEKVFAVKSH